MSALTEKHDLFLRLNREDSAVIVALIDLKTEEDMDKVLNKLSSMEKSFDARLDSMEKSFDARMDSMEARMDSMEKSVGTRLDSIERTFDAKLSAMDHKIDTKINTLYWFVGIAVTIAIAVLRFH